MNNHNLPKPTYWPIFLALSITVIAWGLITSWIVSAIGAIVMFASIIGWMREVSNE